eukprot:CCRYP_004222-RA/>CCRYP_004222-RA protein AED:0.35 eAED:0.35 QI:281/1/1/1/0.5/0.33/3/61/601
MVLPPTITATLRHANPARLAHASQIIRQQRPCRIKPPASCLFSCRLSSTTSNHDIPPSSSSTMSPSPLQTCLALSVHFLHPKLGMKDYEILSRATAFLLHVDPPDDDDSPTLCPLPHSPSSAHQTKSAFPHLLTNKSRREALLQQQDYAHPPASGPKRHAHELNWLEFCPPTFRPRVHVVASSHVLAPWRWPQYYGQEWLGEVREEHVRYSLEVFGWEGRGWGEENNDDDDVVGKMRGVFRPMAKFALNPYPIHHPNGLDVAVIHLKGEEEALEHMKKMGIQPLNLLTMHDLENSTDPVFEPGERVSFHGFEVYEPNKADDEIPLVGKGETNQSSHTANTNEDERIFHPYVSSGTMTFGSPDRFLAKTPNPLPEGLCGGPVLPLEHDNRTKQTLYVRGVVEGIVPTNHENSQLAGSASFLPSYRLREFVDFAERIMLEQIIEPELFQHVVNIKEKKEQAKGTVYGEEGSEGMSSDKGDDLGPPEDPAILAGIEGTSDSDETPHIDKSYQEIISSLHKHHPPEEVDAILATVERERKEVLEILEKEGGDMDDVIAAVRKRTYEERDRILEEIRRSVKEKRDSEVIEGKSCQRIRLLNGIVLQ